MLQSALDPRIATRPAPTTLGTESQRRDRRLRRLALRPRRTRPHDPVAKHIEPELNSGQTQPRRRLRRV